MEKEKRFVLSSFFDEKRSRLAMEEVDDVQRMTYTYTPAVNNLSSPHQLAPAAEWTSPKVQDDTNLHHLFELRADT